MYTKITQAMFAGKASGKAAEARDMEKNEKSKNSAAGQLRRAAWQKKKAS